MSHYLGKQDSAVPTIVEAVMDERNPMDFTLA